MKKQVLIAGGTGMIGSALRRSTASQDWEVTILSRQEGRDHLVWDPQQGHILLSEPRSFDVIINLAGSSIGGGRWTLKRQKDIVDSRVNASQTLVKYLREGQLQTRTYIGASAIGVYGDRGDEPIDESTPIPPTEDWMINTVRKWEEGHRAIESLGIRTIILRHGVVLSTTGGALREILQTAPFGILTYFGHGRQHWTWIHMDDLVQIFTRSMDQEPIKGLYLAASPFPVSNKELTVALSRQFSPRRIVLGVPAFVLQIMLGKMHTMLLQSCKGIPSRLLEEGFVFQYPTIGEAVKDLIKK